MERLPPPSTYEERMLMENVLLVLDLCKELKEKDLQMIALVWLNVAIAKSSPDPTVEIRFGESINNIQTLVELVLLVPFRLCIDSLCIYIFGNESPELAIYGVQRKSLSPQTNAILSQFERNNTRFFKEKRQIGFNPARYSDFKFNIIMDKYKELRKGFVFSIFTLLLQDDINSNFKSSNGRTMIHIMNQNIIASHYSHDCVTTPVGRQYPALPKIFDTLRIKKPTQSYYNTTNSTKIALVAMNTFVEVMNRPKEFLLLIESIMPNYTIEEASSSNIHIQTTTPQKQLMDVRNGNVAYGSGLSIELLPND